MTAVFCAVYSHAPVVLAAACALTLSLDLGSSCYSRSTCHLAALLLSLSLLLISLITPPPPLPLPQPNPRLYPIIHNLSLSCRPRRGCRRYPVVRGITAGRLAADRPLVPRPVAVPNQGSCPLLLFMWIYVDSVLMLSRSRVSRCVTVY